MDRSDEKAATMFEGFSSTNLLFRLAQGLFDELLGARSEWGERCAIIHQLVALW